MIRATCHTVDDALTVEFDATPWFEEADPVSIVHIAGQGWSSTWIADGLEKRPGYERLHELIDYATNRLGEESLEDPAWATFDDPFECTVNGPEAMAWLDENRPEIAAAIRSRHGNAAHSGWALVGFRGVGLGHTTKAATSAPSRALPRRHALCTNWKNPR